MSDLAQSGRAKSSKRPRDPEDAGKGSIGSPKRSKLTDKNPTGDQELSRKRILKLGEQIPTSPKNFNSIATLLKCAKGRTARSDDAIVALCKAFSMLVVEGWFAASKDGDRNESKVAQWLKVRRDEYDKLLSDRLTSGHPHLESNALSVAMALVKAELTAERKDWLECWTGNGYFKSVISAIVKGDMSPQTAGMFTKDYVNKYDDLKYYTFIVLSQVLKPRRGQALDSDTPANLTTLIESLDPPRTNSEFNVFFHEYSEDQLQIRKPPSKLYDFQKQAQKAFGEIFALSPGMETRMLILRILTPTIVPWLHDPTHILDFLTDSFNTGGPLSLLSLSGLYEMMTKHNLDYPSFYVKLYSLLDDDLLHSANRSRFFCLLNEFLGSSHLPGAMIASFIKRLSRLALHAPPAAVVATVPWVYNMLKMHPICTFMIHRQPRTDEERTLIAEEGANEPFDMTEPDPMVTGAIDSCLWELETLQSHFHPNVASLANIISQEFRKLSYSLEDFLDHSYSSLIAGDLGKEMKKPPVVEFEIPKQIFTTTEGDGTLADIMIDIMPQA